VPDYDIFINCSSSNSEIQLLCKEMKDSFNNKYVFIQNENDYTNSYFNNKISPILKSTKIFIPIFTSKIDLELKSKSFNKGLGG